MVPTWLFYSMCVFGLIGIIVAFQVDPWKTSWIVVAGVALAAGLIWWTSRGMPK